LNAGYSFSKSFPDSSLKIADKTSGSPAAGSRSASTITLLN